MMMKHRVRTPLYQPDEIGYILTEWDSNERANLCTIIGIEQNSSTRQIIRQIKWLYYSKTRARVTASHGNLVKKIFSKEQIAGKTPDDIYETPTYSFLVAQACKHLKAFDKHASTSDLELYLSQAVICNALYNMKPRERMEFFSQQVDSEKITNNAKIKNASLRGPATTAALLGAAQASGFGVYMAATTALGFVTHAAGITLPFAVYTGLSSTIAFMIGPAGWLGAGLWTGWKLTQSNWKKLTPALVYIIAVNAQKQLTKEFV